jgi:ribose 5-phosphate isomerase B
MKIRLAADHGRLALKTETSEAMQTAFHDIVDLRTLTPVSGDNYPDRVVPLARAVSKGDVERGIAFAAAGSVLPSTRSLLPNGTNGKLQTQITEGG